MHTFTQTLYLLIFYKYNNYTISVTAWPTSYRNFIIKKKHCNQTIIDVMKRKFGNFLYSNLSEQNAMTFEVKTVAVKHS